MNWEAFGAISEAAGVVGVLDLTFYLATQIKQNTRQITASIEANRLSAFERNIESGNRIREMFILNPDIAELYERGNRDYRSIHGADRIRFEMLVRNIFSAIQGAYVRQQSVSHDPDGTRGSEKLVDEMLSSPGVSQFLESYEPDWRPEFSHFVKARMQKRKSGRTENGQ